MTKSETEIILTLMGINEGTAGQIVQLATDNGKYTAIAFIAKIRTWKHITVHHGMEGEYYHFYTIEIN